MKKKPHLLCFLGDSPADPCGGLGERFIHLLPRLQQHFECSVTVLDRKTKKFNDITVLGYMRDQIPEKNPHAVMPAYWSEWACKQYKDNPPDIVLGADHACMLATYLTSQRFNAKFVAEFDLAMYSYQEIIPAKDLDESTDMGRAARVQMAGYLQEEREASTRADLVITCSEAYKRALPWKTKREAVAVFNGIDTAVWDRDLAPWQFKGDYKKNLVYIGRMNAQKGIAQLLDTQLPPGVALHFVGGEVAGGMFEQVFQSTKRNKQHFHIPWTRGDSKIRILKSANAIMMPSLHAPWEIVGLEAFAARSTLITTHRNGISDYADLSNSIHCEPEPKSIREAIERRFAMSKEDVKTMTDKAFERAKIFTWDAAADKMSKALLTLF